MIKAARSALMMAMAADERVVVLGEDVASGGPFALTKQLAERYGTERVRNTPISEGAFTGAAVGLALGGMRPFVDLMFNDFVTAAADQLFNHAAKIHFMSGGRRSVPMTVWTIGGAGTRWGAQHSQRLDGWFCQVPGLKVLAPASSALMFRSVVEALEDPDPVLLLADRALLYDSATLPGDEGSPWLPRIVQTGTELTIVATGRLVHVALEAASATAVSAEVIDLQRLAPLNVDLIGESVSRTARLLVLHDEAGLGAVSAALEAAVYERSFWDLDGPIGRLTSPATPVPAAPVLEDAFVIGTGDVAAAIERTVRG